MLRKCQGDGAIEYCVSAILSTDFGVVTVKPPSEREGDRVSGGRRLRNFIFIMTPSPSVTFGDSSLLEGASKHRLFPLKISRILRKSQGDEAIEY